VSNGHDGISGNLGRFNICVIGFYESLTISHGNLRIGLQVFEGENEVPVFFSKDPIKISALFSNRNGNPNNRDKQWKLTMLPEESIQSKQKPRT
jgi:hypothetical protein